MSSLFARFPILLVPVLLAACSTAPVSQTTVDRVLKAPSIPNAPYANLLVVGVAPTRDLARELEEGFRLRLADEAVRVHTFVRESPAREVSAEAVQALVTKTGADGILMITGRLGGAQLDEHGELVDIEARNIGGNLLNFFRYDYEEFKEPSFTDVTVDVSLVALLFDAATNERVHSVEGRTTHGDTAYHVITAQADAIVDRMQTDGLID